MRLRTAARALQLVSLAALGLGVAAAGGQVAANHRGWAVDALGWAAILSAVQVALLAAAWRALGAAWWPATDRWLWLRAFAHGWVARYIPGPPTGPAGKLLALRDAGMAPGTVAALLWVDQVLGLASGVFSASVLAVPAFGPRWWALSVAGVAGAAVLAFAGARPALVRRVSRLFGARGMRGGDAVAPWRAVVALGMTTAAALLAGAAFHVVAVVVSPWPLSRWEEGVAVFCLASLAGYVAPFAPSGAGVRESIIVALMGPQLGVAGALTVAVVARATSVLVDAGLVAGYYGASAALGRVSRRRLVATFAKRRA